MNPGRPFDSLYDVSYKVSGARDHYREQNRNAGVVVERVPEFSNMFSKLPHHPSNTYRFKPNDHVPGFVNREYTDQKLSPAQATAISTKDVVSGENRYKYHKRPLLGTISAVPRPPSGGQPIEAPKEPTSRTVGTQSTYRESEAQTLPYSPDYVIPEHTSEKQAGLQAKYHTDKPEVLALKHLKFGDGLPIGLNELNHIDKLREKRAFDASLPPLHDVDQLPRRQAMMEAWEHKEWAERDQEIYELQEERLELLAQAIETREANIEAMAEERVEAYKQRELGKRDQTFASIQKRRIKAVRQLTNARSKTDTTLVQKKSIVQKYGDFGSDVYAPLQREGRFPDMRPQGKEINPEPFVPRTLNGIYELENSIPTKRLEVKMKGPKSHKRLDAKARKAAAVSANLDQIHGLLESTKQQGGRGFGDCWPYPIATDDKIKKDKRQRTIVDRPHTPVAPPVPENAVRHAAATLLQRLLRGRAVQNIMYEGKSRHRELIAELQLQEAAEEREAKMLETCHEVAKELGRTEAAPPTLPMPGVLQMQDALVDEVVGKTIMEALSILVKVPGPGQTAALKDLLARYPPPSETPSAEEEAATRIQSIFRGHKARKETSKMSNMRGRGADLRESMNHTSEEEAAAIKIQAHARGMMTRKTGKTSTTTTKTVKKTITTTLEETDQKKIVMIQARSRGYLARKKQKERQQAKNAGPEADLPDLAQYSAEDQEKIAKIQAQGRGYMARKRVAGMRKPPASEVSLDEGEEAAAQEAAPAPAPAPAADPPSDQAADKAAPPATDAPSGEGPGKAAAPAAAEEELVDLASFTEADQAHIVKIQAAGRRMSQRLRSGSGGSSPKSPVSSPKPSTPSQLPDMAEEPTAKASMLGETAPSADAVKAADVPADAELPDLSSFSEEDQRKIVSMQAQGRGYIARKHMKENQDAAQGSATEGPESDPAEGTTQPVDGGAESSEAAAGGPAGAESAADLPNLSSFSEEDQRKIVAMQAQGRGYIARKQMKGDQDAAQAAATETADAASAPGEAGAQDAEPGAVPESAEATSAPEEAGTQDAEPAVAPESAEATGAPEASVTQDSQPAAVPEAADPTGAPEEAGTENAQPAAGTEAAEATAAPEETGTQDAESAAVTESAEAPGGPAEAAAEPTDGGAGEELPDLSSFSEEDQRKIVAMQAQGRGYITRKHMKETKESSNTTTKSETTTTERTTTSQGAAQEPSDQAVEAEGGIEAASVPPAAEGAAAAQEAAAPEEGSAGQEAAETEPAASGMEVAATPAEELPDLSTFSEEDQQKIVSLQAQGRGYIARKHMKESKESSQTSTTATSYQHSTSRTSETRNSESRTVETHSTMHQSSSQTFTSETRSEVRQTMSSETKTSTFESVQTVTHTSSTVQESSRTESRAESVSKVEEVTSQEVTAQEGAPEEVTPTVEEPQD